MSSIKIIADQHAELCSGGRYPKGGKVFKSTTAKVKVRQYNDVNNTGLGILGGNGEAASYQDNAAILVTDIG